VTRLLVILESIQVFVSLVAFLTAVFLLLDDGVIEAGVQRQRGTVWYRRRRCRHTRCRRGLRGG